MDTWKEHPSGKETPALQCNLCLPDAIQLQQLGSPKGNAGQTGRVPPQTPSGHHQPPLARQHYFKRRLVQVVQHRPAVQNSRPTKMVYVCPCLCLNGYLVGQSLA